MRRVGTHFQDEESHAVCRECGNLQSALAGMNHGQTPTKGSITICAYCGVISILDEYLLLVEPTDAQMAEMMADPAWPELARAQALIRAANLQ